MTEIRYDIDGQQVPPGADGYTFEELVVAWRERDERILAEYGGDPDKANRALGLDNLAAKMQDQALTSYALREGTRARRVYDEIVNMDPDDREALYPSRVLDGSRDVNA